MVGLHDLTTGALLALLDSATVTAWRTGLAAAPGTHALAWQAADSVAMDRMPSAPGARPRAKPRPNKRLPGSRIVDALLPRFQPAAARHIAGKPATGTLSDIAGARHHLVIAYRRDGSPVPTTVWAAAGDGCLYVRTERSSGKVRRIQRDPRALVAASTARGRPLSPPMAVTARVLGPGEEATAETALARAHGWYRALLESSADRLYVDMCYLELKPGAPPGDAGS